MNAPPTIDLGAGDVLVTMESRFTSGNSIPVERTQITRREWDVVVAEIERLRAVMKRANDLFNDVEVMEGITIIAEEVGDE